MNLRCFLLIVILCLCSACVVTAYSQENETGLLVSQNQTKEQMLLELQPYLEIVGRINADYGSSITVPEDGIEEVYDNLIGKNQDLNEFEAELRKSYLEAVKADEAANPSSNRVYETHRKSDIADEQGRRVSSSDVSN